MTSLLNSCLSFHLLPGMGAGVAADYAQAVLGYWSPPSSGALKLPDFLLIPVVLLMLGAATYLTVIRSRGSK
ncbi:MAG TPA: hypothetical protein VLE43_09895 [Candidatus Saccharimonadia bacterium]|nr:hypothetical protein [Candidatus Saccharimonadia bacterium]